MEQEENKKIPFYKRVIMGIKDIDRYQEFAMEPISVAIKYLLKIMLIFGILIAGVFTYQFSSVLKQGISYVKTDMPEFSFTDNRLFVHSEGPLIFEDQKEFPGIIIIDTQTEEAGKIEEYTKKIGLYKNGVVLLKDRVIVKNMASTIQDTQTYEALASKYGVGNFTKQEAIDYIEGNHIYAMIATGMFIVWFIYLFILYFLSALVDAFVVGVLGFLISRLVGMKLRFKSVYTIGIYALTLSIVLNIIYMIVNILTGFTISYFQVMYTSISYIYVVAAILIIRFDLLKRQKELMKIEEEQERVKEEIEEQKRRQKEEEEKRKVDKPKDKKNKSDSKKKEEKKEEEPKKKKERGIGKEAEGEA